MSRSLLTTIVLFGLASASFTVTSADAATKKHDSAPAQDISSSDDPVVARVNGDVIHRSDVTATLRQVLPPGKQPTQDDLDKLTPRVIEDLITRKLVLQQAAKENLQNDPQVRAALAKEQQQILIQAYLGKIGKPAITDDAMHKRYDEMVKTAPQQEEAHARHILVKTEDEAKDVIKHLDNGDDFQKLAKEKSIDKGNAQDGGDLGYFTKESMDPTFAAAAFALQPNTYTKTPVKTSFGYHVIQLLDKRQKKVPTFEEAKQQLMGSLAQTAIQQKLKEIAGKSKIELFNNKGEPITAAPQAPPTGSATPAAPATPSIPQGESQAPLKLPAQPTP